MKKNKFNPGIRITIFFVFFALLFFSLGLWQIERGQAKTNILNDFDTFDKVVRSIFMHRRKKIRNCIKLTFPEIDVKELKYMDLRAEILTPSEIAELSNSIFALKSK